MIGSYLQIDWAEQDLLLHYGHSKTAPEQTQIRDIMTDSDNKPSLSYKDAGVDIAAGNQLVDRIKQVVKKTQRPEVMGSLGGFGALCEIPQRYQQPVLVSGTDGVGTKLRLAMDHDGHGSVGIDLVAMCVNDLLVTGAEPLFFLDYYATGRLNVDMAAKVITGIADGCQQAGCALVGGETAEMPGMYQGEDYDLAGFCVGVAEKSRLISGQSIRPGDCLIGLASSGPHSNGYSLIRKLLSLTDNPGAIQLGEQRLIDWLLTPTRIYVKSILRLLQTVEVKGMAHITGGGLTENLPRMLPANTQAQVNINSWQWPSGFNWLQQAGNISDDDMYLTFNCGLGMVICVPEEQLSAALTTLEASGETAWQLGKITASDRAEPDVLRIRS